MTGATHASRTVNALQKDGREQGEGEGLVLREVLNKEVQDDDVDEDIDDRCRKVWFQRRAAPCDA